jgi:predicted HTH transcriptional regulator
MPLDEIRKIIGQPESIRLEYKITLPPASLIARIIAAFANTEGGWLVIGVHESRKGVDVVGIASDIPAPTVVESSLRRLRPRPDVNHDFVSIDNKQVYVVEVKKSNEVVSAENRSVFLRRGNGIVSEAPLFRFRTCETKESRISFE